MDSGPCLFLNKFLHRLAKRGFYFVENSLYLYALSMQFSYPRDVNSKPEIMTTSHPDQLPIGFEISSSTQHNSFSGSLMYVCEQDSLAINSVDFCYEDYL